MSFFIGQLRAARGVPKDAMHWVNSGRDRRPHPTILTYGALAFKFDE